jgi:hypothetical protein
MTCRRAPSAARVLGAAALLAQLAPPARADQYEATLSLHSTAQVAEVSDRGTAERARVRGAGFAGDLRLGIRNWLDVGAELAVGAFGEASYAAATLPVGDNPRTGVLSRRTRTAQLRGLATLRLGVGWIPTLQLAVGAGARQRSTAELQSRGSSMALVLDPDGEDAEVTLDLVAGLRLGLDHRLNRSWTIGASVGAARCFGIGTPDLQLASATISVAYTWYPAYPLFGRW